MGANKNLWNCPHTDMFSKYQLFLAVVVTQLLWGCESWTLKEISLNDIDVFLHQSIRRIIGIRISQVMEERVSNEKTREKFYNIQHARSMIATRQLQFMGKLIREYDSSMPKQLLFTWVNNKHPRGRPLTNNKISIVKSLQLLYPTTIDYNIIGNPYNLQIGMYKVGSLHYWLANTLDSKR